MALQQDPRKRSPRYTETYSKRNYQPSKRPLVLITTGIVACTVAVAAVAVSCQGGLDVGGGENPGTVIDGSSNTGAGNSSTGDSNSSAGDGNSSSTDTGSQSASSGSASSSSSGNSETDNTTGSSSTSDGGADGSSGSSTPSGKYVPGQSIEIPSTTTSSSGGSTFSEPSVTISFSADREKASLETYYKRLNNRSGKLDDFCDSVFNEHLGSSYATIAADYEAFEKLREKVLKGIVDEDGDWVIYSYYGDEYLQAKVSMAKASKLLVQRLDMIDEAYQAMFALGKGATSSEYTAAASKKLKNYASVTKKMSSLVKSAKSNMGL